MKATLKAVSAVAMVLFVFTACNRSHEKESVAVTQKRATEGFNAPSTLNEPSPPPPPAKNDYVTGNSSGAVALSGTNDISANAQNPPAACTPQRLTSTAAVEGLKDSTHLFIRTADIKCKVQNVANATYKVEDVIRHLGGYVSYTKLTSAIDNTSSVPYSADSSLQITNYSVQNSMVIRVPNTNLDSALIDIAPLVTYLDFRTITANNTALEMLSNRLKQIRLAQHEQRMKAAIEAHAKKLAEITEAEDNVLDKQEQADNAKINNLQLTDQVKYSTINLSLYQPGVIEKTLVFNEKSIKAYEPGLLIQLSEAAQFGLGLFVDLFLFIVRLWPLALVITIALAGYRKWKFKTAQLPVA